MADFNPIDWNAILQQIGGKGSNVAAGGFQMGSNVLSQLGNMYGSSAYNQAIQGGLPQSNALVQQGYDRTQAMTAPYTQQGVEGARGLSQWNQQGPGQFTPVGDVKSFLDPSIAYQQQQVGNQLQAQTGNVGLSGSALKQLGRQTQNVASTGWNNAFNQQQTANQNAYGQFAQNFAMRRQANQDNLQKFLQQLSQGQFGTKLGYGANQDLTSGLLNNQQAGVQAQASDAYSQAAGPYNVFGSALGGLGQIFKGG